MHQIWCILARRAKSISWRVKVNAPTRSYLRHKANLIFFKSHRVNSFYLHNVSYWPKNSSEWSLKWMRRELAGLSRMFLCVLESNKSLSVEFLRCSLSSRPTRLFLLQFWRFFSIRNTNITVYSWICRLYNVESTRCESAIVNRKMHLHACKCTGNSNLHLHFWISAWSRNKIHLYLNFFTLLHACV